MSIVNGSTSAVVQQQQTSSVQRKGSAELIFAQTLKKATSAYSAQIDSSVSTPTPETLRAAQFQVTSDDPYAATDQMLNKFLAQRGSHIIDNISLAAGYIKHELSVAGALPSQIDSQYLFTQIIEKAAEFDENSAGGPPGQSPLRQELAQFLEQGDVGSADMTVALGQ